MNTISDLYRTLPPRKAHQERGIQQINKHRAENKGKPVLAVAPPGAGKSRMMLDLATEEMAKPGGRTLIKVHRKMLLEQLINVFQAVGLPYGVIAADYAHVDDQPIILASTQTLFKRGVQLGRIDMPKISLMINDEAHQQNGKMERSIVYGSHQGGLVTEGYATQGVDVVGFTASPLMSADIYKSLIDIASYSELREARMHQLIRTFSPDEIDTAGLKTNKDGEFSERDLEKRVDVIFGSTFREWKTLNPDARPALLFAPSVASSRWFAQQWGAKGVRVAHLDGEGALISRADRPHVLEPYPADKDTRQEIMRMSSTGEIACIMNRFVLREAIDMPWLYHGIFATVMGLTAFIQTVGRLQRFCADYDYKLLQCHGGSWWRHGCPNDDRIWRLGCTGKQAEKERIERCLAGKEFEGIRCPKCGYVRRQGNVCINSKCRHASMVSVRAVRTISGRLKLMQGRVFKRDTTGDEASRMWRSILFSAALARFASACRKRGISVDLSTLKNPPPAPNTPEHHRPVSTVYPWTLNRRLKSAARAEERQNADTGTAAPPQAVSSQEASAGDPGA